MPEKKLQYTPPCALKGCINAHVPESATEVEPKSSRRPGNGEHRDIDLPEDHLEPESQHTAPLSAAGRPLKKNGGNAKGIRNADVEHLASANQIIQSSHELFDRRDLVPDVDPVEIAWYGPIVMNTQAELRIAFEEFEQGTLIKR